MPLPALLSSGPLPFHVLSRILETRDSHATVIFWIIIALRVDFTLALLAVWRKQTNDYYAAFRLILSLVRRSPGTSSRKSLARARLVRSSPTPFTLWLRVLQLHFLSHPPSPSQLERLGRSTCSAAPPWMRNAPWWHAPGQRPSPMASRTRDCHSGTQQFSCEFLE